MFFFSQQVKPGMKENRTHVLEHDCSVLCSRTQNRTEQKKKILARTQNRTEQRTKIDLEHRTEQEHWLEKSLEIDLIPHVMLLLLCLILKQIPITLRRAGSCSVFELFTRNALFGLLGVRTVRSKWTVRFYSMFRLFAHNELFYLFNFRSVHFAESIRSFDWKYRIIFNEYEGNLQIRVRDSNLG